MSANKIKFLAYYLPQYHQIPENDEWWGEGFTEWTNVKKAKPLFKGHQQPVVPGELGYYDLLKTEGIQEKQASLAKEYGIDGFIYYQYWFGSGKMLLEKPAEKMLANKKVDLPFCFCWANETWRGIWHGIDDDKKILIEQKYLGEKDYVNYFNYLLPFFKDERYIKVDKKPMFVIYDSIALPENFIIIFQNLAKLNGLAGIYFVASNRGSNSIDYSSLNFDAKISGDYNVLLDKEISKLGLKTIVKAFIDRLTGKKIKVRVLNYKNFFKLLRYTNASITTFPILVPNWDNTPRSREKGFLFEHSSPEIFSKEVKKSIKFSKQYESQFIVIKSWNEWAEGNYIEPDGKNHNGFLEVLNNSKIENEKNY